MKFNSDKHLIDRVERERTAHTDDDILKKSLKVKRLFRHVTMSPTIHRLERNFDQHLKYIQGLRILDLGCGHGEQSLNLLERGAWVSGIDISKKYIDDATHAAEMTGYRKERYEFRVMDAHSLDFPYEYFDMVVGRGVLHHLDLEVSLEEIHRVLKNGGRALFQEPLAANPILKLFRILTPQARTRDEKPLTHENLKRIGNRWRTQNTYYGLVSAPVAMITSILLRPFNNNCLLQLADWVERRINRVPQMCPLNQYVLLNLIRE